MSLKIFYLERFGFISIISCKITSVEQNENINIIHKYYKQGKVFYGQEPPSGESTTTECGFNYQLLTVMY